MGGKQSVPSEVKGHPEFFYRGVEEVKVGRYQDAEIYFHQALRQHEGRAFWVDILNGYWGKTPKAGGNHRGEDGVKHSEGGSAGVPHDTSDANEEGKSQHTQQLSSQHSSSAGMKFIDLPVDDGLLPILDYLRLMADIMNAYLCRDLDDKNTSLALVHCCYLGIHIQMIISLMMIWDADNVEVLKKLEEGTLFMVDSSVNGNTDFRHRFKKIKSDDQEDGNAMEGAGDNGEENVLAAGDVQSAASKDNASHLQSNFGKPQHNWKIISRDEIPSGADIFMLRSIVFAIIRHHWLASVFNYCSISLLYVEKRCMPTETKKINHIFQNILEASSASITELRNVFEAEGDKNALALNLLKRMPKNLNLNDGVDAPKKDAGSAGTGSTGHGSGGNHSEASKLTSQFFASLTGGKTGAAGGANSALQTFLSLSTTFSPTYPLMLDTNVNLPIRLNIRLDTPRSKICTNKLPSPGSYNLFYYTNWFALQDVFMVAGYNSNFLNKMLPYYATPAAGEESSFMSKVRVSGNHNKTGAAATFIKRDKNFNIEQMNSTEIENYVDPALRQLMKNDLVKNQQIVQRIKKQKSYYNPMLKHNDPYTLKTIIFEEDVIHTVYPIFMQSKVLHKMGKQNEAEAWTVFLLRMGDELYGRESQELAYFNRIVDTYK